MINYSGQFFDENFCHKVRVLSIKESVPLGNQEKDTHELEKRNQQRKLVKDDDNPGKIIQFICWDGPNNAINARKVFLATNTTIEEQADSDELEQSVSNLDP